MENTLHYSAPMNEPLFQPSPRWPDVVPPVAPQEPLQIRQLGRVRIDPYAWMRFIAPGGRRSMATLPERLRGHLEAEMHYARQVLEPLSADAAYLREQMLARAPVAGEPATAAAPGWRYASRQPPGAAHRVFVRVSTDGTQQTLIDEGERAQGHAYYRATDHQPSPDQRYFAWAEDVRGDDRHRICVLDTITGKVHVAAPADAFGYGGFTFSPSSRHVFWLWRDAHSRPTRLYRSRVDGGAPELVYEEHDPALFMQVGRTAADGFVVLSVAGPDTSEVRLIRADDEEGVPEVLRPRQRGTRYEVVESNDALLMLIHDDSAPGGRVAALDPHDFSVHGECVPPRPGVHIIALTSFARGVLRLQRVAEQLQIVLMQPDGGEHIIAFDEPAYHLAIAPMQAYQTSHVRLVHQTPAQPPRWIDLDLESGAWREVGGMHLREFDPGAYRVERLYARADDGESIPITVLAHRDTPPDAPLPLVLAGYGAYGVAFEAEFSLPACVLVDAGFRYAIAHVRGGAEKGPGWYRSGCREHKRNSMTDFIACARHLVDTGRARADAIVAHGVSAGGLLVCGAMNMAPQLWAGVIAQVPFVDMLNTMSDADHPLVPLLRPDWGDPLADTDAYDHIAAISPYENVTQAAYPPLLCTAGLQDDRVPYWEPAKLVATIRAHSTSRNPALLLLNPDSGHQERDDMHTQYAQAALLWAFARRCVAHGLT